MMKSKLRNPIKRSRTPTIQKKNVQSSQLRNARTNKGVSKTKADSKKVKPLLSKSPLLKTKKTSTINKGNKKQALMMELLKKDKQLKQKLTLIQNQNEQMQKTFEKSKKDKSVKEKNYLEEKQKLIQLFCNFVLKKEVNLQLSSRNLSLSRRSISRQSSNRNSSKHLKQTMDQSSQKSPMRLNFVKKSSEKIIQVTAQPSINDTFFTEYIQKQHLSKLPSSKFKALKLSQNIFTNNQFQF